MAGERPDYNQLAAIQGLEGATLRVVAVDASGQIIMVPRGAGGNYMSVDASGYLSSVMKGIEGATLRTIAVDASGNIIGILKGDYMGAVKTLAVDAQGRMLAVLTDPEDVFGNPNYMGAAELAVRLGSINTFDRLGQVVFQDSFESLLGKWDKGFVGGAGTIRTDHTISRSGLLSAMMQPLTGAGNSAYLEHFHPFTVGGKIGLEASFSLEGDSGIIQLYIKVFSTTHTYHMALRFNPTTNLLQYLNSALGWTTLDATLTLYCVFRLFHTFKMVSNTLTGKYDRAVLDNKVYDMSAISVYDAGAAASNYVHIQLVEEAAAGAVNYAYWDDVILTQNEV